MRSYRSGPSPHPSFIPGKPSGPAIRESAAAVIFIHNHPSGDIKPSQEDILLTRRLVQAGEVLGIQVLDHIIIGDGSHFSFRDNGLIQRP